MSRAPKIVGTALAVTVLGAPGVAAANFRARNADVSSGPALARLGLRILAPAKDTGVLRFPVASSTPPVPSASMGRVPLDGGLRLGRGRRTASLQRIEVRLDRRDVLVSISGAKRIRMATLVPAALGSFAFRMRLTPQARRTIRRRLRLSALPSAALLPALTIDAVRIGPID